VLLGTGLVSCVIGYVVLLLAGFPEDGPASNVSVWAFGLGVAVAIFGLGALTRSLRMGSYLRRHPWQTLPVRHELSTWGGTPLLALGDDGEHVVELVAMKPRWGFFSGFDAVLVAGDAGHKGVVATPDEQRLAWVRRPHGARYRDRIRRKVAKLEEPSRAAA